MSDKTDIENIVASSRRNSRWRTVIVGIAVLALAGGGYWYWFMRTSPGEATRYTTAKAAIADVTVSVTATGTVEPTNKVEISSELSGTVRSVEVDYNDDVKVGQILARLDTDKLEATVELRRASLVAAQARVSEADATLGERRAALERMKTLTARGIGSQEQLLTAQAAFARAEAAVTSAKADVRVAQANLDVEEANLGKACICSPINGVVLDRAVDAGQIVASSLQAPVLFTIAEDLRKMELLVDIDEADIGKVSVGNKAEFTVEAFQNRPFPAKIAQVRYAPETVDGVVAYKAVLAIDNADLLLRPGMTATAEIVVAEVTGALTVPNAALRYEPPARTDETQDNAPTGLLGMLFSRPPSAKPVTSNEATANGTRTLWLDKGTEVVGVQVRTGATDGKKTVILEGDIKSGDEVITGTVGS